MKSRTIEPVLQRQMIERATAALSADKRVLAAWLEGSFASGTEDVSPSSDASRD